MSALIMPITLFLLSNPGKNLPRVNVILSGSETSGVHPITRMMQGMVTGSHICYPEKPL
jgi:hypothetical protein